MELNGHIYTWCYDIIDEDSCTRNSFRGVKWLCIVTVKEDCVNYSDACHAMQTRLQGFFDNRGYGYELSALSLESAM